MLQTAKGIVLQRRDEGESDTLAHMIVESGERITLRVYGIRASKKRGNLLTEPGNLLKATYYAKTPTFGSLKEAVIRDGYGEIKSNYRDVLVMSYVLDITHKAMQGNNSNEMFLLLKGALDEFRKACIEGYDRNFAFSLLSFYKVRLFKLLGLLGDTDFCSSCGGELEGKAAWMAPEMFFQCPRCNGGADSRDYEIAGFVRLFSRTRFQKACEHLTQGLSTGILPGFDHKLAKSLDHYFSVPSKAGEQLYGQINGRGFD